MGSRFYNMKVGSLLHELTPAPRIPLYTHVQDHLLHASMSYMRSMHRTSYNIFS